MCMSVRGCVRGCMRAWERQISYVCPRMMRACGCGCVRTREIEVNIMKMKPKYSGSASKKFWDRIAKIKLECLHDALYVAGCALQDHEHRMNQMLDDAEKK